ncbi:DUF2723 domain-containing protein [Olivibacter ginsenosidimutans]|uniref:DUF2723 domain-containing protein n=1 Tax=Olivibacter ginsenosidimutans TaxID=1176537 RepID=A0ABP9BKX3_9SPHI
MEMTYKKLNNFFGWTCCLIATLVYFFTKEPTVSFWDCGEFIAASYKLQIVHQPGAPLFLMIQNIFSNLALGDKAALAYWMNTGSAICSGLTILFLFWTITFLTKKALLHTHKPLTTIHYFQLFGAGVVGSLAYAFSDSFWFSAVETEVYAMSSLGTALVFWLILKWENHASEPRADKWLVLLAFIMGLSIGVHLLNLLTIPVLALVIYFKRTPKVSTKGILKTLGWSLLLLALILWGIIQYLVKIAAFVELFFVNQLGLHFGSGILFTAALLTGALIYGFRYSIKKNKPQLNLRLLCFTFVLFGYGSFAMVAIRASANPSLNNYSPDHIFSFLEYISRDQYIPNPLLTGKYFDSQPTAVHDGAAIYRKDQKNYTLIGHKPVYDYDRTTLFPRVHSQKDSDFYRYWLHLSANEHPNFISNIQFFTSYQAGVMFWRYFMWNFVGRQNDNLGQMGNLTDGNWLSGIKAIDNMRLGGQYALPKAEKENPSRNQFYFFPLLLGIIGLCWHYRTNKKDMGIVSLFFFFTGLAIVLYLNDTPIQPRERDYVYVGAFYAFSIWIGFSVIGLTQLFKKKFAAKYASISAFAIAFVLAPLLMIKDGWDDHDRSQRYSTRDLYARNYLESCAPNAILFTYGDNDTFPLWYAQEVENIRPDIRIVNIGYLSSDWYVKQMRKKINQSAPLPIDIDPAKIDKGVRDYLSYEDYGIKERVEIKDLLAIMLSDHPADKSQQTGENFLPTKKLKFAINKHTVLANHVVPKAWNDFITDSMEWDFNQDFVTRSDLAFFNILINNQWKRPIYFSNGMPKSAQMGLNKYLVNEGMVSKLMPIDASKIAALSQQPDETAPLTNYQALYSNLMQKYTWGKVNQLNYLDPLTKSMVPQLTNDFNNLSRELLDTNQREAAREVANKCLTVLPQKVLGMNQAVDFYYLSDTLYEVNETNKANDLMRRNGQYVAEQVKYKIALAKDKPQAVDERDIRLGMGILQAMLDNSKKYKQMEMEKYLGNQYAMLEKEMNGNRFHHADNP